MEVGGGVFFLFKVLTIAHENTKSPHPPRVLFLETILQKDSLVLERPLQRR